MGRNISRHDPEICLNLKDAYWNRRNCKFKETSFEMQHPLSLNPSIVTDLLHSTDSFATEPLYINEIDAVREILFMLQGHDSDIFHYLHGNIMYKRIYSLQHLTGGALDSIMIYFTKNFYFYKITSFAAWKNV
jgi:hypothetical protein